MDKRNLTLIEHLDELRTRLIICLIVLAIDIAVAFPFSGYFLNVLRMPARGLIDKLAFFGPQEAFMAYFRVSFFSALIIAMPFILYQVWEFVSKALEERFRRHSAAFIIFSLLAFISGCLFAYFLLLPKALRFLLTFGKGELEPVISVGKYISFAVSIILCTGLVFEMPVLSFILSRLGILNHRFLRKRFKYAVLVVFIVAAVITPTPDVFNMVLLAIPMLLLYEVSIWVSFFAGPKAARHA